MDKDNKYLIFLFIGFFIAMMGTVDTTIWNFIIAIIGLIIMVIVGMTYMKKVDRYGSETKGQKTA